MQALNDKGDGHNHLFRSGHSMNIYQRKCILVVLFYFLQILNILPFLFNEFKLN